MIGRPCTDSPSLRFESTASSGAATAGRGRRHQRGGQQHEGGETGHHTCELA